MFQPCQQVQIMGNSHWCLMCLNITYLSLTATCLLYCTHLMCLALSSPHKTIFRSKYRSGIAQQDHSELQFVLCLAVLITRGFADALQAACDHMCCNVHNRTTHPLSSTIHMTGMEHCCIMSSFMRQHHQATLSRCASMPYVFSQVCFPFYDIIPQTRKHTRLTSYVDGVLSGVVPWPVHNLMPSVSRALCQPELQQQPMCFSHVTSPCDSALPGFMPPADTRHKGSHRGQTPSCLLHLTHTLHEACSMVFGLCGCLTCMAGCLTAPEATSQPVRGGDVQSGLGKALTLDDACCALACLCCFASVTFTGQSPSLLRASSDDCAFVCSAGCV